MTITAPALTLVGIFVFVFYRKGNTVVPLFLAATPTLRAQVFVTLAYLVSGETFVDIFPIQSTLTSLACSRLLYLEYEVGLDVIREACCVAPSYVAAALTCERSP